MIDVNVLDYDYDEEALGFDEPALAQHDAEHSEHYAVPAGEKLGLALVSIGLLVLVLSMGVPNLGLLGTWKALAGSFGLMCLGGVLTFWSRFRHTVPGIKHDGVFFRGVQNRGLWGWVLGIFITGFYVVLYFYDDLKGYGLPQVLERPTRMLDPLSQLLSGGPASRWFLYGFLYTAAVAVFGVRMLMKYRHNRYQRIRTLSVMGFQLVFAFLLPNLLKLFHQPEHYFTYFWPLKREYLFPNDLSNLSSAGGLPMFMAFWSVVIAMIGVPLLTYYFGKRWYCSWVCGCGGLAETLGDPFRQQSSKSLKSWKIERWMIHSVLVFVVVMTAALWINSASNGRFLGAASQSFNKTYGFLIGAVFAGVIGVGFYPLLGSRVWCRFGCPQAAILGLFQRFFSRFRITTNGSQCMSCGNCSTYCEMGIDVRAYAQRSENIVRASCVGCGVCAAACPRGVLKLENGSTHADRYEGSENPIESFFDTIALESPKQGHN